FPFLVPGAGAIIAGPTGGGRSSLVQACAYDAASLGVRVAYLGSEVTQEEFSARAAILAGKRADNVDDDLRERLARVRYLDLTSTTVEAWRSPDRWVRDVVDRFDVVILDPLSSVAAALDLDFDTSNADFVAFYARLVQPLVTAGVAVPLLDNIGHDAEARNRPKGASAKRDCVDLEFAAKLQADPAGLLVTATKVR
ncbi:MAG: AAA family ATPase, partial [Lysobacter sp.]|nr:AAA family ATPase [Lysobacter sp.]